MADVTIGGATYNGVEQVDIPLASGAGKASFFLNGGSAEVPYNVNLLDNADWYAYAINQRGNASYSGLSDEYGVDRWRVTGTISIAAPTASTVGLIALSSGCVMKQRMEILPSALKGKTVTAAIDVGGTVYSGKVTFPNSGETTIISSGGVTVTVGVESGTYTLCGLSSAGVPYIKIMASAAVNVYRVWLELGNTCHMETTAPKGYAENLAACQRYFVNFGVILLGGYTSGNGTKAYIGVPVPTTMRTLPVLINYNVQTMATDGTANTITAVGFSGSTEWMYLNIALGTPSTAYGMAAYYGSLQASAEL